MTVAATAWSVTWVSAAVLLLAGVAKARRPTVDGLAFAGLPDSRMLARTLGVAECLLAAAILLSSHWLAAALAAVTWATFTIVSWRMVRSGRGSCGCFGEVDAPMTRVHVVVNGAFTVATVVAAIVPAPVPEAALTRIVLVAALSIAAVLVKMLLTLVPALADGLRRLQAP